MTDRTKVAASKVRQLAKECTCVKGQDRELVPRWGLMEGKNSGSGEERGQRDKRQDAKLPEPRQRFLVFQGLLRPTESTLR